MNQLWKPALILGAVAFSAATVLSLTDHVTRKPIQVVSTQKRNVARAQVLPGAAKFVRQLPQSIPYTVFETKIKRKLDNKQLGVLRACYQPSSGVPLSVSKQRFEQKLLPAVGDEESRKKLQEAYVLDLEKKLYTRKEDLQEQDLFVLADIVEKCGFKSAYRLKASVTTEQRETLRRLLNKAGYQDRNLRRLLAGKGKFQGKSLLPTSSTINDYFVGYDKQGERIGFVFEAVSPQGYAGDIEIVVGIGFKKQDGTVTPVVRDYMVIKSTETPGLGKDAEKYLHRFYTNRRTITNLVVKEEGRGRRKTYTTNQVVVRERTAKGLDEVNPRDGQHDVKSSATITSQAIKDALYACLKVSLALMGEGGVRIDISERQLDVVPYASKYEKLSLPSSAHLVRELYEGKSYYGGRRGYVAKALLSLFDRHYLALIVFRNDTTRVFNTRVYRIRKKGDDPFETIRVDDGELLRRKKEDVAEAKVANPLEKMLKQAVLESLQIMERMENR